MEKMERPKIPSRHPSLIMDDRVAGTPTSPCGCKGTKCIKDSYFWLYAPDGEVKNPRSDCHTTEGYHFKTLSHESVGRQL